MRSPGTISSSSGLAQHTIHRSRLLRGALFSALLLLAISPQLLAEPAKIQAPENQGVVLEEKDLAIRKELAKQVEQVMAEPRVAKKIVKVGRHRTMFCNVCHGEDGNAVEPGVPNLAGQNPVYLLDQFQRFGDGRRYDFVMSTLSGSFSEKEKVLLALYFSQMTVKPAENVDTDQLARGEEVYKAGCAQCHGDNGRGEKGYARLAGQKPDYVLKMLNEFRNYTGRRANPWMTAVSLHLSKQEMTDVAAFISAMK